jgi:eukaryotic-like serine/threonine-protein kinase
VTTEPASAPPRDLPGIIGGYRVLRELGRGRLGPVVLARHRPSGELVALRVLKPEWACLPKYVSRLTRAAFAAAQVEHPNLVRLKDFGEASGRVYFASEFVDGTTLADRVKGQGALAPRDAVAFVLQAARALRFVHAQGLTHGAVTPGNLLVDRAGVTRLSDLGLVKTPVSVDEEDAREKTGPIALGANPQADAFAEAVRDDVKGLGLALARLLTGAPGRTDPTSLISAGLPMNLVELVRSLLGKEPSGLADMGQAVAALERFLNAKGPAATAPTEEHGRVLAECLAAFRASPSAKLRARIIQGSAAGCAAVVLLCLLARLPLVAGSFLGLGLMTALAYFVIDGVSRCTDLFTRVRALILASRGVDWLSGVAGLVLFLAALVVFQLQWAWLAFGVLAVILALALHQMVDRKVDSERRGAVEEAEAVLRGLRLQGVSEEANRRFVRASAGDDWEEFFEALFGYPAKLAAREPSERGLRGLLGKRYGRWRDAIRSWVEARLQVRRQARETVLLQAIEERGFVAEGINLLTARRRAWRTSAAMVAVSSEIRAAATGSEETEHPSVASAIRQAIETPENVLVERERGLIGPETSRVRDVLTGPRTRFLLGSALVAGFLLWVHQNGIISGDQIKDVATKAIEQPDPLQAIRDARIDVRIPARAEALDLPFLPRVVGNLFQSINPGVAGLILIISALVRGVRVGLFALPGAAIVLIGPALGLPGMGPLRAETASLALGAGVAILGLVFAAPGDD